MSYFIFAKYLSQSEKESQFIALKVLSPCYPEGGGGVNLKRWRDRQASYDFSIDTSQKILVVTDVSIEAWIESYDHKAIYLGHVTGEICRLVLY